ncbi:hypothetical protein LJR296_007219 [Cupriavidus necator]|uniref:hypothetical protein n=1 Tax=Cupriavidus necator TaxID=106590 RepID=UPI003ECDDC8E
MKALSINPGAERESYADRRRVAGQPAERAYDSLTVEILRRHVRRPLVMFMPSGRELLSGAV